MLPEPKLLVQGFYFFIFIAWNINEKVHHLRRSHSPCR